MVKASKEKDRSHILPAKIVDASDPRFPHVGSPRTKGIAVRYITQKKGSVVCLSGIAGTGKTFVQKIAYKAWTKAGYEAFGRRLGGKSRAWDCNSKPGCRAKHFARPLPNCEDKKRVITSRTIVVADEAGMIGTRGMVELLGYVRKGKGKLVLVGGCEAITAYRCRGRI